MPSRKKPGRSKAKRTRRRGASRPLGPRRSSSSKTKASGFEQALTDLTAFFEAVGAPAAIIGGIAVIAWGFGRSTLDVDAAIAVPPSRARALLKKIAAAGFLARIPDAGAFAEKNLVLLLRHRKSGIDVDLSLAQLDFEHEALTHAQSRQFGMVTIQVPRPTDLVVYKMIASRPRDLQDVEELLARGLAIDPNRVERLLREFDALLELDRAGEWLRLLDRRQAGE